CGDDAEVIAAARRLFSYLPSTWQERPAAVAADAPASEDWEGVVPERMRAAYDVHAVIERVFDRDSFFEIKARWAKEVVVGFARLHGEVVGLVANQPKVAACAIDVDSSDKAARFITMCDAFNVPIV